MNKRIITLSLLALLVCFGTASRRHKIGWRISQAGFSPLDLGTKLVCWLDAQDASTITLVDTDKVSAWADKSTHGNDTVQATPANQRTYVASDPVANNLPCVCNDSSDIRYVEAPAMTIAQVFVVCAYKDGLDSAFDQYSTVMCGPSTSTDRIGMGTQSSANWFTSGQLAVGASKNGGTVTTTGALPMPLVVLRFDLTSPASLASWDIGAQDASKLGYWRSGCFKPWLAWPDMRGAYFIRSGK